MGYVDDNLISGEVVDTGYESTLISFSAALSQLGFVLPRPDSSDSSPVQLDSTERAMAAGRRVAAVARSLRLEDRCTEP